MELHIHAHLDGTCENALRLRHYVCPHCHTAKGNPEALMKKLLTKKHDADTECDGCGKRFPLWDALEKKFASTRCAGRWRNFRRMTSRS